MITFGIKIGSTTITGPTFSIASQVDIIHATIYGETVNSGICHIWYRNGSNKGVFFGSFTEDLTTALTISIILQSDDATEIDPHNENGTTACGIKDITVELLQ